MRRIRSRARRNGSHSKAGSNRHLQFKPPLPQRNIRPRLTTRGVAIDVRTQPAAAGRATSRSVYSFKCKPTDAVRGGQKGLGHVREAGRSQFGVIVTNCPPGTSVRAGGPQASR